MTSTSTDEERVNGALGFIADFPTPRRAFTSLNVRNVIENYYGITAPRDSAIKAILRRSARVEQHRRAGGGRMALYRLVGTEEEPDA